MANIKSAIKRIDVTKRQTLKNRQKKSELKTLTKKFNTLVESDSLDEARELLKVLDKKLKKAVSKSVLHKNAASRKLSKLASKLNK